MRRCVIAIAAHPDDIEFFMAGTLLRLGDAGWELHYLNLADGCCGSTRYGRTELAQMRTREAEAACRLAGATFHRPHGFDLELEYETETLRRVAAVVREVRPSIVLTHAPTDYMEDHEVTARLAASAAFVRGMLNFATDPPRDPYGDDVAVYHAQPHGNRTPLGEPVRPGIFVDTSGPILERKTAMLACHESQRAWLDESQKFDSYLAAMQSFAGEVGAASGRYEQAEGWRQRLHLGYGPAGWNPLVDALPDASFVAAHGA
jgi:LmbE family N-acetylglucosaminyl deacetylase